MEGGGSKCLICRKYITSIYAPDRQRSVNWFSKLREKNLPVSGQMLQEKSKQVTKKHGLTNFKGSNGSKK